jgi:CheY-like chemotaxis protein
LVVEDDDYFRQLLVGSLERVGLDVSQVSDGRQALDALRAAGRAGAQHRFSAVVTDYQMPNMTGMELVELLAAVGVAQRTVLLSAFLDPDSQRWAQLLGVAAVVRKPLDFKAMAKLVREVAERRWCVEPRAPSRPPGKAT